MADAAFNTIAEIQRLRDAGFPQAQAEAITLSIHSGVTGGVATKGRSGSGTCGDRESRAKDRRQNRHREVRPDMASSGGRGADQRRDVRAHALHARRRAEDRAGPPSQFPSCTPLPFRARLDPGVVRHAGALIPRMCLLNGCAARAGWWVVSTVRPGFTPAGATCITSGADPAEPERAPCTSPAFRARLVPGAVRHAGILSPRMCCISNHRAARPGFRNLSSRPGPWGEQAGRDMPVVPRTRSRPAGLTGTERQARPGFAAPALTRCPRWDRG